MHNSSCVNSHVILSLSFSDLKQDLCSHISDIFRGHELEIPLAFFVQKYEIEVPRASLHLLSSVSILDYFPFLELLQSTPREELIQGLRSDAKRTKRKNSDGRNTSGDREKEGERDT